MTDVEKILEYLRGGSKGKLDLRWGVLSNIKLRDAKLKGADISYNTPQNSDHWLS